MNATNFANDVSTHAKPYQRTSTTSLSKPSLAPQSIYQSTLAWIQPPSPTEASTLSDDCIRELFQFSDTLLNEADNCLEYFNEAILRSSVRDHRSTNALNLKNTLKQNATRIQEQLPMMNVDWGCLDNLSGSHLYQIGSKLLARAAWQHTVRVDKMGELLFAAGVAGKVESFNTEGTVLRFVRSRIRFNDEVTKVDTTSQTATTTESFQETYAYGTQTVDTTTKTTTTDIRTDTTLETHEHDIVNASRVPFFEAQNLPERINVLRRDLPPSLFGATEVLYGDLIRHRQQDALLSSHECQQVSSTTSRKVISKQTLGLTEAGKAKQRRERDPGVLLGGLSGYVLAGWLPGELD